jgi:hypothetical protein
MFSTFGLSLVNGLTATNAFCRMGRLLFQVEIFSTFGIFLVNRLTAPIALPDFNQPVIDSLSG